VAVYRTAFVAGLDAGALTILLTGLFLHSLNFLNTFSFD